jgi:hypothetical protein
MDQLLEQLKIKTKQNKQTIEDWTALQQEEDRILSGFLQNLPNNNTSFHNKILSKKSNNFKCKKNIGF